MTKIKKIRLDSLLIPILKKDSFDSFTVIELRNEYLHHSKDKLCPLETRKFVYKQILRLVNLGVLVKNGKKNSQDSVYKKTNLLREISIEENNKVSIIPMDKVDTFSGNIVDKKTLQQLEKKLNEYQVDMMSSIGESEEYIRLYESYPEMKDRLKTSYHLARDRSSKLLGRIKAIETTIFIQRNTL